MHRDDGGESSNCAAAIRRANRGRVGRAVPLLPWSLRMLVDPAIPVSLELVGALTRLNLDYNLGGWRQRGVYGQLQSNYLEWKLQRKRDAKQRKTSPATTRVPTDRAA